MDEVEDSSDKVEDSLVDEEDDNSSCLCLRFFCSELECLSIHFLPLPFSVPLLQVSFSAARERVRLEISIHCLSLAG